ncbi:oligopeptide/dipeptide ABC transporter ATP-binding protein [Pararhizobium sp. LjRoot238]|uniref:oligopeptide/dipeptide ABC transporter ATP-binding protein n=1 Tax=Pararhizobium sp. LjRoot238 TaxID=3342293 RepID=UPI003ECD0ABA
MTTPVLSLKGASVRYGDLTAVDGVSIDLHVGETLGLVGESGCGKSSIARAISGLAPLSAGSYLVESEDVAVKRRSNRRFLSDRVQLLFQDPVASLSPRLTVGALLAEPLKIRKTFDSESWAATIALLQDMGLGEQFLSRYPHQLSGGQARRVALARVLTARPKIIVADEPTAGLDVSIQGDMLNLLRALRDKLGLSYLFISHNLNVVGRVTERVAIMYLGQIVETGKTGLLFQSPAHPYTQALLSSNLTIDPQRRRERIILKGELPSPRRPPSGCRFHQRCPVARDICATLQPRLETREDGRAVACHFPLTGGTQAMTG